MDEAPFALLDGDDAAGGAASAILFSDLRRTITLTAASFAADCAAAEAAAQRGCGVVAALDYELGHALEPGAAPLSAADRLGHFWIFARQQTLDQTALAAWLDQTAGAPPRPACVASFTPALDAAAHAALVQRIKDYIRAGDCYQTNLTFSFSGRLIGDAAALYARLRAAQPVRYGACIVTPQRTLLSFSPELFIERSGRRIRARPMKGTARRGADATSDAAQRAGLAASEKDRAENLMITDLIRNDLGRIARPGSVQVEELFAIETYPSLHQMVSQVSAELAEPSADADSPASLASVLRALFPCGSITGAPKVRAMQIISELEKAPRGIYTGALGRIGPGSDFRLAVAIRTLEVGAAGSSTNDAAPPRLRYGAGSGIVFDSQPAAEYAECLLKASFITNADPGFSLIETLRLENGAWPLLDLHLKRLAASAQYLHFALDMDALRAALAEIARCHDSGVWRIRISLTRCGELTVQSAPLAALPPRQRAVFAEQRLPSASPWLRHKTSFRPWQDAALAQVSAQPEFFDAIFCNERDEVCEGARSTLFIRRRPGAALLTPPLACGLLPGVLRQHLLNSGAAHEELLYPADLASASEVFLGNALRGLLAVELLPELPRSARDAAKR